MNERPTQILKDTDTQVYTPTVTNTQMHTQTWSYTRTENEEGGHQGGTEAKGNTPGAHWGGGRTRLAPGRAGRPAHGLWK